MIFNLKKCHQLHNPEARGKHQSLYIQQRIPNIEASGTEEGLSTIMRSYVHLSELLNMK